MENKPLSRKQIRKIITKNKELEEFLLEERVLTKYIENARVHSFTHREEVEAALESSLDWAMWRAFYWDCTDDYNLWVYVHSQAEKRLINNRTHEKSNKK